MRVVRSHWEGVRGVGRDGYTAFQSCPDRPRRRRAAALVADPLPDDPVSHERTQTPQNNLSCGAPGFPAATSDSVMTSDGGSADAVRPTRAPPAPG